MRSASRPARVDTAISGGIREPMLSPMGRCTRAISTRNYGGFGLGLGIIYGLIGPRDRTA